MFLFLSTLAAAGGSDPSEPLPHPRARATRNVGIGLTVPGALLAGLGGGLMISGAASMGVCSEGRPDCNTGNAFQVVGGGAIVGLSVPFLATGIGLWATGAKKMRKNELAIGVMPQPGGGMVQLGLRF